MLLRPSREVVDLEKVSIGFETLGIDVQVQMAAYADPALPWTDVTCAWFGVICFYSSQRACRLEEQDQ